MGYINNNGIWYESFGGIVLNCKGVDTNHRCIFVD